VNDRPFGAGEKLRQRVGLQRPLDGHHRLTERLLDSGNVVVESERGPLRARCTKHSGGFNFVAVFIRPPALLPRFGLELAAGHLQGFGPLHGSTVEIGAADTL
jgi:hypothetical protein